MKRLISIGLVLTLALGMVWAPAVAGAICYPFEINKIAYGPAEDFTFEAWRDFNNNGVLDGGDVYVGQVVITGNGTAIICVPWLGPYVVHEVLIAGSVYGQPPDQVGKPEKHPVYFYNERTTFPEVGQIEILKQDGSGKALNGACFNITPDPRTGTGYLELCDNDANDKSPLDGVLLVTGCLVCVSCTVTETKAPDGYQLDPTPQSAHVTTAGETVTLTFVNTKCELTIYKVDGTGDPLAGACFNITPDPRTGTDVMTLCDNGPDDDCPADGVLCLSELICGLNCTVEETVVPEGYVGADPQTVTIGETLELTFVNTREQTCGTVCAAQTAPGQYLFSAQQQNWFTWIYYVKGWGTEALPKTYPIYTGITTLCGTLYVYDNGIHIFVNYVLTDTATCTLGGLSQYHLQVDRTLTRLKRAIVNKSGNPVPGKAEYKGIFDPMVASTGWIEATNDNIASWTTAYIFAHGIGCYYCP